MRKFILLALLLLSIQIVSAANLDVEVLEEKSLILVELDEPATFTLAINNKENVTDNFEIFSIVGVSLFPKEPFQIEANSIKELEVTAAPHEATKRDFRGAYLFEYQIKGQETGFFIDRLTIKIIEFKDAIRIVPENINLYDNQTTLRIENLEDYEFKDMVITAESKFFEFAETMDFAPKEQKEFTVSIKKEEIKKLPAGEYEVDITISFNNTESEKTATVKYLEKGGISISTEASGFIVRRKTITKTNEGNIATKAIINQRKDVLSRLFTTYSDKPLTSERKGLFVDYTWEKELGVGEQLTVTTKTNFTLPFLILIAVVLAIFIVKFLIRKNLSLQKKVSFVKTKGGEFALKIKLRVKARKQIENIKVIDMLPRLTKFYEKFGTKPDEIDTQTRKISWNINKLNSGETRVFTYIIYSKVNIFGRFELPSARAVFSKDGKHEEAHSNKAYFAAETSEKKED